MSLFRAWLVLVVFWFVAMALVAFWRSRTQRQRWALQRLLTLAGLGAALALAAAGALVHFF